MSDVKSKSMGPGIVTVNEWLCAPDGRTYMHFWSENWEMCSAKDVIGSAVRGNSGFFIIAIPEHSEGFAEFIVPGCRFSSFVLKPRPVTAPSLFNLDFG